MKLEERWGLSNLEVPLSEICGTESFCWFASAILNRLPRFWEIYNTVLGEFRRVNRIRSQSHPVPALVEDDGWFEAPFWVWRAGERKRNRVLAKACTHEVRLSDGKQVFARWPISDDGDLAPATSALRDLPSQGIRFRTRALTTTLFARVCLADLFVHGVGGAKYDEMTDRLIARFFGLPAPGFLTLSCTVNLPLGEPFPATPEEEQRMRHRQRDLKWNPERHLLKGCDKQVDRLIDEKQALIAATRLAASTRSQTASLPKSESRRLREEAHHRHLRLKEISRLLSEETREAQVMYEAHLADIRREFKANAVLQNREFSFALYPEQKLRPFLTELFPASNEQSQ
jgi:hypothetical protein